VKKVFFLKKKSILFVQILGNFTDFFHKKQFNAFTRGGYPSHEVKKL
jgi:hypothetical protein